MPTFDTSLEADIAEVRNAVDQAAKEIGTRFDFKGSSARVEQKDRELTCHADNEFQLGQVREVLISKCAKRQVDVRFLSHGDIQKISGDKIKQLITIRHGIAGDDAKRIVKILKDGKLKIQAWILSFPSFKIFTIRFASSPAMPCRMVISCLILSPEIF